MRSKGQLAGSERTAHHRRVAYLCGQMARILSIEAPGCLALSLAARVHGSGQSTGTEHLVAAKAAGMKSESFEAMLVEMAEAILHRRHFRVDGQLEQTLELAANILQACEEFDDEVEFAAYNQVSIPAAVDEFFNDAGGRFQSGVLNALREFSRSGSRPVLRAGLPVLPAAAAKLMRSSAEETSPAELESIVSPDPVLTARLLGAANSGFFGSQTEIRKLRQAIMRVGVPYARKVLMAACIGPLFASAALVELWQHSRIVAASAHELAAHCGYDQEVAYIAGLLHDIGRLVTQCATAETRETEADLISAGFPLTYAENLIYGSDHAIMGGDLLRKWRLPQDVIEAVTFHHRPESATSLLPSILYLAEDDATDDMAESENLATGMRRAVSGQTTGISLASRNQIDTESPIYAIA